MSQISHCCPFKTHQPIVDESNFLGEKHYIFNQRNHLSTEVIMVDNSCHPLLIAHSLSADSLLIIIKMWDGMEGGMATIFWQSQKLQFCSGLTKGSFQKLFSGFCPLMGYPTPPLNRKSFCQKTLGRKGGYIPPPLTESPLSFSGKFFPKRAKNDVFFIK